ncbi:MAG TPA: hypothetical protein VHI13_03805 [Candidatus Kapabacteria bacterium]|nr:hypothetical protein [Candidatus Kapabacteria bacterium]
MPYQHDRTSGRNRQCPAQATPGRYRTTLLFTMALWAALVQQPAGATTFYAVVLATPRYTVGASTLQSGLFVSTDNARTWRQLGPRNVKGYSMDAVDSSRGRILFMAAGNGVHRSTDFGATWRVVTDWRMTEVMDVMVDQHDPRWVYAATAFGFWRSGDGGDHWENPSGELHGGYTYRLQTLAAGNELVVAGENRFFRSTDHGSAWQGLDSFTEPRGILGIVGCTDGHCGASNGGCRMYATGEGVMVAAANPGRRTPDRLPGCPRMNVYAMIPAGGTSAYVAGDSGIWLYNACTSRCEERTANIPNHIAHALVMANDTLVAGTFGDGLFRLAGNSWEQSGLEGAIVWTLRRKEW